MTATVGLPIRRRVAERWAYRSKQTRAKEQFA